MNVKFSEKKHKYLKQLTIVCCAILCFFSTHTAHASLVFLPFSDVAPRKLERDLFFQGALPAAFSLYFSQVPKALAVLPDDTDSDAELFGVGWYRRYGQDGVSLQIELALVSSRTGDIVWQGQASGETADIFPLFASLTISMSEALQLALDEETELALRSPMTRDPYAFVIFGRGINALLGLGRDPDAESASEFFRKAVLIDPKFAEARFLLARLLAVRESADVEKVIALLKTCVEDRPRLLPAYRMQGSLYTQIGMTALAAQSFTSLLQLAPDDAQGRMRLAELLVQQGNLAAAKSELLEVSRRHPDWLSAYELLASISWEQGQSAIAADALRAVLRLHPKDTKARAALGAYLREIGDAKGAEILYRSALQEDPKNAALLVLLGDIRAEGGDRDGAYAAYEEALRLRPEDANIRAALGLLYLSENKQKEAAQLLESAALLGAKRSEVLGGLGLARISLQQYAAAESALREALSQEPQNALLHYNLGVALLAQDECAEAKLQFSEAVLGKPDFAAAHYNLGLTAVRCPGEMSPTEVDLLAQRAFERAIVLDASLAAAHYNLAALREAQNDKEGAAKALEGYLMSSPSAADRAEVEKKIRALRDVNH